MGGTYRGRAALCRRGLSWLGIFFVAAAWTAPARAAARLRIKNGHNVMIALEHGRESASAIRPDKKVWTLELTADLVGGVAELEDVTPNLPGAHWTLAVSTDHLVLDATRFLPSHVYRVEVRRERQVLGSAFVYLYPPPAARITRVDLQERPEADGAREPATGLMTAVKQNGSL